MKNKPIIFLSIMGTLCVGASVAIQSDHTRIQKFGVMGFGAAVLAGVGSAMALATEKDGDDDDPRMKDVYDELNKKIKQSTRIG